MLSDLSVQCNLPGHTIDQLAGNYEHIKGMLSLPLGKNLIPYFCKHEEIRLQPLYFTGSVGWICDIYKGLILQRKLQNEI